MMKCSFLWDEDSNNYILLQEMENYAFHSWQFQIFYGNIKYVMPIMQASIEPLGINEIRD